MFSIDRVPAQMLQPLGVSPGDSIILLNDIILGEEQVEVYQYVTSSSCEQFRIISLSLSSPCSMVDLITSELLLHETLSRLSISSTHFSKLLSVPVHSQSNNIAVDVRSEAVIVSLLISLTRLLSLSLLPFSTSFSTSLSMILKLKRCTVLGPNILDL